MTTRKYRLRPGTISGAQVSWDWISDADIERLLWMRDGMPISLQEAARMYYEASIREDSTLNSEVLALGIVGYALSLGLRIDIFPELIEP